MVLLPRDVRLAARTLLRKPGAAALAVVSLALAIGFSAAAFSVLDAYSLRDLPVREPSRLARGYVKTRENRFDAVSWIEYQALAKAPAFDGLAAEDREGARVRLPDRDDFPIFGYVSDNYFDVLGVRAAMGDVFHAGRGQDQTVVITHHYWTEKLGSDPAIIGRTLPVGPTVLRVIGVLPPGFTGANRGLLVEMFMPPQTFFGALRASSPANVRYTSYELIGRLRRGATPEEARAQGDAVLRQVESSGSAPAPDRRFLIDEFGEGTLTQKLESNAAMLAMIVLLLAIGGVNLANLRLVDNESRRQETGIRLALGADASDLARQHLAETVLLAAAATGGGLLVARWLIGLAPALFYRGRTYLDFGIRLDVRVFAFSAAAMALVALLGAAIPFSDALRRRIIPALHGARATRPSRWLSGLLVAQMALVTAVACSAGLLWRSVDRLAQIRPAMDPNRSVLLVRAFYDEKDGAAVLPRIESLTDGLARLPGVVHVGLARRAMLSGSGGGAIVEVELAGEPKRSFPYNNVSPGYFAATGARVLSGRAFGTGDGPAATPVIMVNALFGRRFFDGRDPLGAWVRVGGVDRQIVGVVEDGPHNHLLETPQPYLYFPFAQKPTPYFTWMIQTAGDPARLAAPARAFLRSKDPSLTVGVERTLASHMRDSRSENELAAAVAGALAAVGLLLAAAGVFGVTLYAVSRRTPEFGVRAAMGASPARLIRQVLRESAVRVAAAVPLGWALAWAGRGAISKLLYGVAPEDPRTFALATAVVALMAFAAALRPALRAAKIDPMTALRHE